MLSHIKAYQLERASQRFSSQNSRSCCTQVICVQKDHFRFGNTAMFFYIHRKCSGFTDWMV